MMTTVWIVSDDWGDGPDFHLIDVAFSTVDAAKAWCDAGRPPNAGTEWLFDAHNTRCWDRGWWHIREVEFDPQTATQVVAASPKLGA